MNDVTHHGNAVSPLSRNEHSPKREKNNKVQNYRYKDCGRQFIADNQRTCHGTRSRIIDTIKIMLVRGVGRRNSAAIPSVSVNKILHTLVPGVYEITPRKTHYDTLEIDELWTYVSRKTNKMWLIYAYHRAPGENVAYVWENGI